MSFCQCGLPLHKETVATIPGSIDTKFVEIEVCANWLDPYHDDAVEHRLAEGRAFCPACGADIPADGQCFYCETNPNPPASKA